MGKRTAAGVFGAVFRRAAFATRREPKGAAERRLVETLARETQALQEVGLRGQACAGSRRARDNKLAGPLKFAVDALLLDERAGVLGRAERGSPVERLRARRSEAPDEAARLWPTPGPSIPVVRPEAPSPRRPASRTTTGRRAGGRGCGRRRRGR